MLNLLWGVKAYYYDKNLTTDKTIEELNKLSVEKGYAEPGDFIVNLSSMPVSARGMVNTLRISQV